MDMDSFEKDLKHLINIHSVENASNTPDWLLAQYLIGCLENFATATQQRETYYGRDPRPSANTDIDPDYEAMKADLAK